MNKLKVFYNNNQSTTANVSLSPSAGKPKIIAERFAMNPRVEIVSDFKPLELVDFSLAHEVGHVTDVLECKKPNGFENTIPEVAATFPWTNGSFYAAAEHALLNKTVTMSPTSGFHHAGYQSCEGFCTFNGLMISAIKLKQKYNVNKIGIVDIDAHYGNGTQNIIDHLRVGGVEHYTFGELAETHKAFKLFPSWLRGLNTMLETRFSNCDVILYQAGADPHIEDPYGGYLTTEQMLERDNIVFAFAKKHKIPLVWNLAGGYQTPLEKVIALHMNTLESCLKNLAP